MKRRAESRKGMVTLNVALEKDMHRELAIAGLDENASMNELIRDAVKEWLGRREKERARVKPRKGRKL